MRRYFEGDPDYWYDPDNWESTYDWELLGSLGGDYRDDAGLAPHEPLKIATLYEGPPRFAIRLPTVIDEEGQAEEWGPITTFPSQERAVAAYEAALRDLRLTALG